MLIKIYQYKKKRKVYNNMCDKEEKRSILKNTDSHILFFVYVQAHIIQAKY